MIDNWLTNDWQLINKRLTIDKSIINWQTALKTPKILQLIMVKFQIL